MAKKIKEETIEKSKFQETLDSLNKKYGVGTILTLDSKTNGDYDVISSGSIGLDWITLGVGGFVKGKLYELVGWEGTGKAQPLSSKILTPNGWKTMGEMEIGSIISTPDGKNSTVIGIYPQGEMDIYEITFDDKTSTKCTLDHLWYVKGRVSDKGEVLSTKEIIENGLKKSTGVRNFKIPTVNPIEFEQYGKITINPYLLGILIGDGGLTDKSNAVKFTCCDSETLEEIKKIINKDYENVELSNVMGDCGYYFKKKGPKSKWSKNPIFLQLDSLGLMGKYSYEKHIPKEYLLTTIENRISLLQGLMDSDGTSQKNKNSLSYSSSSIQLSKDFEFLCRSLGMRCSTSSKPSKYKNSAGNYVDCLTSYRSNLLYNSSLFDAFRSSRKKIKPYKSEFSERFIEKIEFVGREKAQCISIGHPDKLYITDDFIVTHNTSICGHAVAECQKKGGKVLYIDGEHAVDKNYFQALGVDTTKMLIAQPSHGEEGFQIAIEMINSGELDLVIIDSDSSLIPKAVLDGEVGDSSIGKKARLNSNAYPKLKTALSTHNVCVIVISQYREKIGQMFGDPRTTQGGHALKFYSDCRIEISRTLAKEGDVNYGNITKLKAIKNKMSPPYRLSSVEVLFGKGIDRLGEIMQLASDFEILKKYGKTITWKDTKYDIDDFSNSLAEDDNFFKDLKSQIVEKIQNTEIEAEEPIETE